MLIMTIFEPLFLLLALVTAVTLLIVAGFLVRGKVTRAGRIAGRLAIGAAIYFLVVIVASLVVPRREYSVGSTQCFDDWCIAVLDARRDGVIPGTRYEVSLRLSNRAKRVPMGEKGTVVYLTDAEGRRYDPTPEPEIVRFDTVLEPGTSVIAKRHFEVPLDARDLGLIYRHEGGFPIGWLIIGEGGWFSQPAIVRLH